MNEIANRIKIQDSKLQITDKDLINTDTATFLSNYVGLISKDIATDDDYKKVKTAYKEICNYKSEIDSIVKQKVSDFTKDINSELSEVTEPLTKVIDLFYSQKDKYESDNCLGKYKRRETVKAKTEVIEIAQTVLQTVKPIESIKISFDCENERQKQQLIAYAALIGAKVSA